MVKRVLPSDVTLRDVVPMLASSEEYVRLLLGAMHVERRARGDLVVRLGTLGTGRSPNYRFDAPDGNPLVPYDGQTHRPWPSGEEFRDPKNWSAASWTYEQVAELRGELGRKR